MWRPVGLSSMHEIDEGQYGIIFLVDACNRLQPLRPPRIRLEEPDEELMWAHGSTPSMFLDGWHYAMSRADGQLAAAFHGWIRSLSLTPRRNTYAGRRHERYLVKQHVTDRGTKQVGGIKSIVIIVNLSIAGHIAKASSCWHLRPFIGQG
jgi:hypothetical protein